MLTSNLIQEAQKDYQKLQNKQENIYNKLMVALQLTEEQDPHDYIFDFLANDFLTVEQTKKALSLPDDIAGA